MKIKRETIVAGSIISRRIYGGIKKTPGEKEAEDQDRRWNLWR